MSTVTTAIFDDTCGNLIQIATVSQRRRLSRVGASPRQDTTPATAAATIRLNPYKRSSVGRKPRSKKNASAR